MPPSSLGNGLVHDSRLSLSERAYTVRSANNADLATGIPWSGFVANFNSMNSVGFRPAQVRSKIEVIATGTDTSRLEVIDQSVYISDDDANFRTEIETYLFANVSAEQGFTNFAPAALGARPTSVETFSIPGALAGGPELGFSLAWVYDDDALPWELRVGLDVSDMATQIYHLRVQGYRPISISSRERGGISEYAAVFVDDGMPHSDWEVSLGIDDFDIAFVAQDKWDNGLYAFRGTTEHGTWTRFNMIWTKRPPGLALEPRFNLTLSTFQTEDALRRSEGYHLESLDRYLLNGYDRYAAIWVRYEPCLRWAGTWFGANDPDYVSKYQMFHDQALVAMNFTGMTPGAQWIRPSSTLHIVDGGQMVLNRAYTFAPAIYPDTEIDAPFRLASISKSITAAAVVDVMNDASLPLTTSFTAAANIANVTPASMSAPTVLDVLRSLGGFRGQNAVQVNNVVVSAAGDPVSYIPCDGADLQNDTLNCGSCGLECPVLYADTEYAVGQCNDGVCGGPYWYETLYNETPFFHPTISCAEMCADNSRTCVARGCSGKTGYMCAYALGEGCLINFMGIVAWTGECNEDIPPFELDTGVVPAIGCCCDD